MNKADLNKEIAEELEEMAVKHSIVLAGRIPYDREVTRADCSQDGGGSIGWSGGPRHPASLVSRPEQLRLCVAPQTSGLVQILNPRDKQVSFNHERI